MKLVGVLNPGSLAIQRPHAKAIFTAGVLGSNQSGKTNGVCFMTSLSLSHLFFGFGWFFLLLLFIYLF